MTSFIVRTSIAVATDRAGGSRDIGHDAVLVVMTVVTTIRGIGVRVACSGGGTAAARGTCSRSPTLRLQPHRRRAAEMAGPGPQFKIGLGFRGLGYRVQGLGESKATAQILAPLPICIVPPLPASRFEH